MRVPAASAVSTGRRFPVEGRGVRKRMLVEEFHVRLHVPHDLPRRAVNGVLRVLNGRPFQAALARAVRELARRFPPLETVGVRVTR